MAKANLTLPSGTTVNIEGTAEEVALLVERFSAKPTATSKEKQEEKATGSKGATVGMNKSKRGGLQALIQALVDEDFFKAKQTIGGIQKKLEEKGHIYPLLRISTPLLRLTRSKVLRRFKEEGTWKYVNY